MKYLLDTCVISELVAKRPEPKVIACIDSIDPETAFLSVITLGEIQKGIQKLPRSDRKSALQTWLRDELPIMFSGRILPIDTPVALRWGELAGELESRGKKWLRLTPLSLLPRCTTTVGSSHAMRATSSMPTFLC